MRGRETAGENRKNLSSTTRVGTLGHMAVFAWLLCLSVLAPGERVPLVAGLCLTVIVLFYPDAASRLIWPGGRLRIGLVLLLAAIFAGSLWVGSGEHELDSRGTGFPSEGFITGVRMVLRALMVLLAVSGLSGAVDIGQLAGLFERIGFRGLGFSLGVAINLLPSLSHSFLTAWQSIRMRGGLRERRWRAMKLLLITVIGNALRRSREIALAAEARAFRPDRIRPLALKKGSLDAWIVGLGLLSGLAIVVYP